LEIETAELVADRTLKWAKTFNFFVGIPVFVVILLFGFMGIKSWYDITNIRDHLTEQLNTAPASRARECRNPRGGEERAVRGDLKSPKKRSSVNWFTHRVGEGEVW